MVGRPITLVVGIGLAIGHLGCAVLVFGIRFWEPFCQWI